MQTLTSWLDQAPKTWSEPTRSALAELEAGHARFRKGKPTPRHYTHADLAGLAEKQTPIAAVIACSDSRVVPDVFFDQPIGSLFNSRVPGNVAADSAKWMLEIAVADLNVPLVAVIGHSGCLAVGEIVQGKMGAGGSLRFDISYAVHRARLESPADLHYAAVEQNVLLTIETLRRESTALQKALEQGRVGLMAGVYHMPTGEVRLLGLL
jgi:carbonic anhydrase